MFVSHVQCVFVERGGGGATRRFVCGESQFPPFAPSSPRSVHPLIHGVFTPALLLPDGRVIGLTCTHTQLDSY